MSGKKRTASPLPGSRQARQYAAAILSVLAGEKTTAEASGMMKVSLPRYYQLESKIDAVLEYEMAKRIPLVQ